MQSIPESDWKILRRLKDEKLAMLCGRVLEDLEEAMRDREGREHEVFLASWEQLQQGNEKVAMAFDDLRRSRAIGVLRTWKTLGLLNDEERALFTEGTRRILSEDY